MDPSIVGCSSSIATLPKTKIINLKCIDTRTQQSAACTAYISPTLGGKNGGHDHTAGRIFGEIRAPGTIGSEIHEGDQIQINIPTGGVDVTYQSPEASGDVVLNFTATGPDGSNINVNPTTVHVKNSTAFIPIDASTLAWDVASHPQGTYGTTAMNAKIRDVVNEYYQLIADANPPLSDSVPIRATSATLPYGGLFDVDQGWIAGPSGHCGHRDGKTIDFGLAHFQGPNRSKLKNFLQRAIKDAGGLSYGIGEGPANPTANHWHVHMN